jgi:hypothetical protein
LLFHCSPVLLRKSRSLTGDAAGGRYTKNRYGKTRQNSVRSHIRSFRVHVQSDKPLPTIQINEAGEGSRRTTKCEAPMSAFDAVDGSSTGTRVPRMWELLRLPRFRGVSHANGYDGLDIAKTFRCPLGRPHSYTAACSQDRLREKPDDNRRQWEADTQRPANDHRKCQKQTYPSPQRRQ